MKKNLKRVVAVTLATLMLAACSSDNSSTSSSSSSSTTSSSSSSSTSTTAEAVPNLNKTGFPIVNETVELSVVAGRRYDVTDFNDMAYFQWLEEQTNVKINWTQLQDEGRAEQLNLIWVSGDLPDAFYGNYTLTSGDAPKYGSQGLLIPLNDYIENDAVYFQNLLDQDPSVLGSLVAPDGNIYGLPTYSQNPVDIAAGMFINTNWLDQVGMDIPSTTDELFDVLVAFKEAGDLNGNGLSDELPTTFLLGNWINGLMQLYGSFGLYGNGVRMTGDGTVAEHQATTEGWKELAIYLNKLYEAGLIDPESLTQDNSSIQSKLKSTPPSVGFATHWGLAWAYVDPELRDQYTAIPPLIGPSGEEPIYERLYQGGVSNKAGFVITSSCENPDVAFRWGDALYEEDVAIQAHNGFYGLNLELGDDGIYKILPAPDGLSDEEYKLSLVPGVNAFQAVLPTYYDKMELKEIDIERFNYLNDVYADYQPDFYTAPPPVFLTDEETEEQAVINTNLGSYINITLARWITEGGVEEEWDSYIAELEKMGVFRLVELQQGAYDRYFAAYE